MNYMKNNFIVSLAVIIIFFAAIFFLNKAPREVAISRVGHVEIGGVKIRVDLAATPEKRTQGLSGRESLNEDEGLLFIFDVPNTYFFWMKDMKFPIDMIWLDQEKKITYIKENARPESYPESYGPNVPSLYVLEVVSGFTKKNNIKVGDNVKFLP